VCDNIQKSNYSKGKEKKYIFNLSMERKKQNLTTQCIGKHQHHAKENWQGRKKVKAYKYEQHQSF
jgi:hypothetical protein